MFSHGLNLGKECIPVGCVPPAAVAVCWGGSASVHAGIHPPRCGLGDPPGCGPGDPPRVWAWRHPQPVPSTCPSVWGLETPPHSQTPQPPPGCGPGDPPSQNTQPPSWVWAWIPPPSQTAEPPRVWAWRPPLWTDRHV